MNKRQLEMFEKVHAHAIKHGGRCLNDHYDTGTSPLKWVCKEGHMWEETWQKTYINQWCKECFHDRTFKLKEIKIVVAIMYNGLCLSTEYINTHTPLDFQCDRGHVFDSTPNSILNYGAWCNVCFRNKQTLKKVNTFMEVRGGKCLSTLSDYKDFRTNLRLLCSENHLWEGSWLNLRTGASCPDCKKAKRLAMLQEFAVKKGGKCLTTEYIGSKELILWQCHAGHMWERLWYNVNSGEWCPICKKIEKFKKGLPTS